MDKIGRPERSRLLSQQVSAARYFFLNLAPNARLALTLVMGGRERCNPDYRILRSSFPFHVLEYVEAGRGSVQLDRTTHELAPGVVFAYGPRTRYEIWTEPADPMIKYFMAFSGRDAARRVQRAGIGLGTSRRLAAHAEVTSVCEDLVREGQRTGELAMRICATLFELLLLKIEGSALIETSARDRSQEAFLRCKAVIDAEAEHLESLDEIARRASVDVSSVCRWFRRFQGTSPYQYLIRRKMNIAAEHLIENGGLVKEAAERVGFTDAFHFSRAFKSVHGVAPRDLLRWATARS